MVRFRILRLAEAPLACLGALCLCVLAACGAETGAGRQDVADVYERTMRAVHAGDWQALEKELTKEARFTLESDMRRLARRLGHAEGGKREREIARSRLGDEADAAIEQGAEGGLAGTLKFFVRIAPRDPVPLQKGLKLEKFKAEILYALPNGEHRLVRFVRLTQGWFVSELQL